MSVGADELERRAARRLVGVPVRHGERPEDRGRRADERGRAERAEPGAQPPVAVGERQRPAAPEQQPAGLAHDGPEPRVPAGRGPDAERAGRERPEPERRDAPDRGEPAHRVVPDAERGPSPPEQRRAREAERGALELALLQHVEAAGRGEQHDGGLRRAAAALEQVEADDREHAGERQRRGVHGRRQQQGLGAQQHAGAQWDVGRQGRGDIRGRGEDRRGCGSEREPRAVLQLARQGGRRSQPRTKTARRRSRPQSPAPHMNHA